jgi:hypothetical protein
LTADCCCWGHGVCCCTCCSCCSSRLGVLVTLSDRSKGVTGPTWMGAGKLGSGGAAADAAAVSPPACRAAEGSAAAVAVVQAPASCWSLRCTSEVSALSCAVAALGTAGAPCMLLADMALLRLPSGCCSRCPPSSCCLACLNASGRAANCCCCAVSGVGKEPSPAGSAVALGALKTSSDVALSALARVTA